MDVRRFLQDYNIQFMTEGNKHCTSGWINIHCPLCPGSQDYHLGIEETGNGVHCWRCGGHSLSEIVSRLLGISFGEAGTIIRKYSRGVIPRGQVEEAKVSIFPLKYPSPNMPLNKIGREYLRKRGFDPDKLEEDWGILQTGPISFLDKINYSHRILIPIYWDGEIVSFQARDITNRSDLKYLACPKRREKIHHKNILYGNQKYWKDSKALIVVEGVPDVWRFGPSAVATFGIEFKMNQVLELAKAHKKFFIIFDDEPQAQLKARELAVKLKTLGRWVQIVQIEGDPGEMEQEKADNLVKELLGK